MLLIRKRVISAPIFHVPRSMTETPGERLRRAKKARNVDNAAIAAAAGVHPKTVSRWLNDKTTPDPAELDGAARFLRVTSDWIRNGGYIGAPETEASSVREAGGSYSHRVMAGLPFSVREWIQAFLLRLVRARVSEREFERARALLESEELAAWYAEGGGKQPATEEAMLESAQAAGDFIIGELTRRGYKFDRQ
jgi:transcriptional regulator with XRE-family HTH domain